MAEDEHVSQSDGWRVLEEKVALLIQKCEKLLVENREQGSQVAALEAELEAVQALRKERDGLRSEKDAVKRRVEEMLKQLEALQLA